MTNKELQDYLAQDGFEVIDDFLPEYRKRRDCRKTIEAFLDSGNQNMGKRIDDRNELLYTYTALRNWIKRNGNGCPVIVSRRDNMLILSRKEEE